LSAEEQLLEDVSYCSVIGQKRGRDDGEGLSGGMAGDYSTNLKQVLL
jgi:hypothetical protein